MSIRASNLRNENKIMYSVNTFYTADINRVQLLLLLDRNCDVEQHTKYNKTGRKKSTNNKICKLLEYGEKLCNQHKFISPQKVISCTICRSTQSVACSGIKFQNDHIAC